MLVTSISAAVAVSCDMYKGLACLLLVAVLIIFYALPRDEKKS